MVRALRAELGTEQGTVSRVARQLGYGFESVRSWVRQADIDDGYTRGVSTAESQRVKELVDEYIGNDRWKWSVWLDGDDAELDGVEAVEYHLHPTFPEPVKEVTDRATRFRLDSGGWGAFELNARVRLKERSVLHLTHTLELFYPEEEVEATSDEVPTDSASVSPDPGGGPDQSTSSDRRRSVFLSFGSADNSFASELQDTLISHGLDVRSVDDIEPGAPWAIEMERTIGTADAVVAVSSDVPSSWVDREVGAANQLGVRVIPVAIGQDAVVPSSLASHQQIQIASGDRVDEAAASILRALEA